MTDKEILELAIHLIINASNELKDLDQGSEEKKLPSTEIALFKIYSLLDLAVCEASSGLVATGETPHYLDQLKFH